MAAGVVAAPAWCAARDDGVIAAGSWSSWRRGRTSTTRWRRAASQPRRRTARPSPSGSGSRPLPAVCCTAPSSSRRVPPRLPPASGRKRRSRASLGAPPQFRRRFCARPRPLSCAACGGGPRLGRRTVPPCRRVDAAVEIPSPCTASRVRILAVRVICRRRLESSWPQARRACLDTAARRRLRRTRAPWQGRGAGGAAKPGV